MNSVELLQTVVTGLLLGGVYALVALGLTLVFGVMNVINFAHGSLIMLGMFFAYWAYAILGIGPYISAILLLPLFFALGVVIQRLLMDRVLEAPHLAQFLLTLGLTLVLENIALFLWGPDFRSLDAAYTLRSFSVGGFRLTYSRVIAFAVAAALSGLLFAFLRLTDLGKAIRAVVQEPAGSRYVGINLGQIYAVTFGMASALAGVAGALTLSFFFVYPYVGSTFLIKAFIIVFLGGMGNILGALLGGLIFGVLESLGGLLLPGTTGVLLTLALLIVILLFRPQGLFVR